MSTEQFCVHVSHGDPINRPLNPRNGPRKEKKIVGNNSDGETVPDVPRLQKQKNSTSRPKKDRDARPADAENQKKHFGSRGHPSSAPSRWTSCEAKNIIKLLQNRRFDPGLGERAPLQRDPRVGGSCRRVEKIFPRNHLSTKINL